MKSLLEQLYSGGHMLNSDSTTRCILILLLSYEFLSPALRSFKVSSNTL